MTEITVVGRGVDTLVLNVCYADDRFRPIKQELADELQHELEQLQFIARQAEEAIETHWKFKGFPLYMQPKGSRGQWRWILTCPYVSVAVSRGLLNRIIAQVRLSSEFLWKCETVCDAIVEVSLLLFDLFGEYLWVQVSGVDLCADVVGWDVSRCNWQEHFVSRAVGQNGRPADIASLVDGPDVVRCRWKQVATLDFGKHTSPLSCCLYFKSAEIAQKSPTKVWFHDLWKRNGWDGESDVWRVEFRLTRELLHVFHIEDVHDLPEHIPALWEYCAGRSGGAADGLPDGWLRYVTPTMDTTRSRWPVHPAWAVIQAAFSQEDAGLGPLVRDRIREKNIKRGLAAVMGYLSTLSAWVGGDLASDEVDISQVLHWLAEFGASYLEDKGVNFSELVEKKKKLYRSDDELAS